MAPSTQRTLADAAVLSFDSIDSTSDEAVRQLRAGTRPPFRIIAHEQTRGRGRENRHWLSPPGNLYATFVIQPEVAPSVAVGLSLVAGLAGHDALSSLLPSPAAAELRLKWPNDLMLDAAKLGGILLETSQVSGGAASAVLIGMGLNLAIAPELAGRDTVSAGLDAGVASRRQVFEALTRSLDKRIVEWDEGRGFEAIRTAWLERAYRLGQSVSVRIQGELVAGLFRGINESGALELVTPSGQIRHVLAGEVFAPA